MRVRVCAVACMIGCSVLCSTVMGRVNFYLRRLMMFFDEFDSDPSLHLLKCPQAHNVSCGLFAVYIS